MSRNDHFPYEHSQELERFDNAFEAGVAAAQADHPFTDSPYGLPVREPWDQWDILINSNPQYAGWLLGWWAGSFLTENTDGPEAVEHLLYGAGHMAALLWWGLHRLETTDDEQVGTFEERRYTQEEIAEALGCSVEEIRERAKREGWPYVHVPKDPARPLLTVYPNPQGDR